LFPSTPIDKKKGNQASAAMWYDFLGIIFGDCFCGCHNDLIQVKRSRVPVKKVAVYPPKIGNLEMTKTAIAQCPSKK